MSTARVEALVWVLIYGGLLLVSLGMGVQRQGRTFGWALVGVGAFGVLAGVVLIWFRSRMQPPAERAPVTFTSQRESP